MTLLPEEQVRAKTLFDAMIILDFDVEPYLLLNEQVPYLFPDKLFIRYLVELGVIR